MGLSRFGTCRVSRILIASGQPCTFLKSPVALNTIHCLPPTSHRLAILIERRDASGYEFFMLKALHQIVVFDPATVSVVSKAGLNAHLMHGELPLALIMHVPDTAEGLFSIISSTEWFSYSSLDRKALRVQCTAVVRFHFGLFILEAPINSRFRFTVKLPFIFLVQLPCISAFFLYPVNLCGKVVVFRTSSLA